MPAAGIPGNGWRPRLARLTRKFPASHKFNNPEHENTGGFVAGQLRTMNVLIIKLGATGDVVRTTALLHRLKGSVTWLTAAKNRPLLPDSKNTPVSLRVLDWPERDILKGQSFDLVINLEDDAETAAVIDSVKVGRLFGAYAGDKGGMFYTEDSSRWFDLSLISSYGREQADRLKFQNRLSYQELVFAGLGWNFVNEGYLLPPTPESDLQGDIAIAPEAGPIWPMKSWAHYDWLKAELEGLGLKVNFLPNRPTLLQHLADVRGHRCVISGDSLPMHLAIGSGIKSVALFNCTSPWEIHDYGLLTKLVSPLLGEFFYKREFDPRATTAVRQDDVLGAVLKAIDSPVSVEESESTYEPN
jgi:heptosyltransferase-2